MNVNQYLMINLEIIKEITVQDKVMPNVKFEMMLPHGVPWADAELICDEFKASILEMKRLQELNAAQAAAQAEPSVVVEPEIVDPQVIA